jgi:hypothetical protein
MSVQPASDIETLGPVVGVESPQQVPAPTGESLSLDEEDRPGGSGRPGTSLLQSMKDGSGLLLIGAGGLATIALPAYGLFRLLRFIWNHG